MSDQGKKDPLGAFLPDTEVRSERNALKELDKINPLPPMVVSKEDLSAEELLFQGLGVIHEIMYRAHRKVRTGTATREDIATVKDCMAMLHEFRKAELKDAAKLNDEDLEQIAKGAK